jgi:hypothetical protein
MPPIDLRDTRTAGGGPEIVHRHATILVHLLRDGLALSTPSPETLETLIGLCELRLAPAIGGSIRAEAWHALLERFAALDAGSLYVGAFKVQLDGIVDAATPLGPPDRSLLARLVLDRTAAVAATRRDLRIGARAAHSLDPFVLAPSVVIDHLLRPCIRWGTGPRAGAIVADALLITLDSLANGSGRSVHENDVWALRAALSMIGEHDHPQVHQHVARVTGADRALIEKLLAPAPAPRRWWARAPRREADGRHLSLR